MPVAKIVVSQGVGTNLGTHEITEGAEQRHLSRTVLNNEAGVTILPLTDAQLRATPLIAVGSSAVGIAPTFNPVSISGIDAGGLKRSFRTDATGRLDTTTTDTTATGSITALNGNIVFAMNAISAVAIQITGTWVATLQFEATLDGTNWSSINAVSASTSAPQPTTTANGLYRLTPAGASQIRVIAPAFTSGTVTISIRGSMAVGGTFVNQILPTRALKDTARSSRNITLDAFNVAVTTEVLNTISISTDNGVATTGTAYTVTAGKRFMMQSISASITTIAGNTTPVSVVVRLRTIQTGTLLVTSPVQFVIPLIGVATANNTGGLSAFALAEGYEFPAGSSFGVTTTCTGFVATTAAPKVNITIIGFEY